MTAKLLLVHGDAAKRVPYSGSKMIYDHLVADNKGQLVRLVTIPGMGHAPVAQNDLLLYYGAWIEFLK